MVQIENQHFIAGEGKAFRHKSGFYTKNVFLGLKYYDDFGNKLATPIAESIDDYEEVDNPEDETLLDNTGDTVLSMSAPDYSPRKITVRDYIELENRVAELERKLL